VKAQQMRLRRRDQKQRTQQAQRHLAFVFSPCFDDLILCDRQVCGYNTRPPPSPIARPPRAPYYYYYTTCVFLGLDDLPFPMHCIISVSRNCAGQC
jgi:hypothetical protein